MKVSGRKIINTVLESLFELTVTFKKANGRKIKQTAKES